MNAPIRNQARFFSIDMEAADAALLTRIFRDQAQALLQEGRVEVQQRLADYGRQISRYQPEGADLFAEADFAEACIHLARARQWQVVHEPRQWDRHGVVTITLTYHDGGIGQWTSRSWRVPPGAAAIDGLRRTLRQIAPDGCVEAGPD